MQNQTSATYRALDGLDKDGGTLAVRVDAAVVIKVGADLHRAAPRDILHIQSAAALAWEG